MAKSDSTAGYDLSGSYGAACLTFGLRLARAKHFVLCVFARPWRPCEKQGRATVSRKGAKASQSRNGLAEFAVPENRRIDSAATARPMFSLMPFVKSE